MIDEVEYLVSPSFFRACLHGPVNTFGRAGTRLFREAERGVPTGRWAALEVLGNGFTALPPVAWNPCPNGAARRTAG
jgi:hypothetical protein